MSSTIVVYGLAVAALVMTGAKLSQRFGWISMFRNVVAVEVNEESRLGTLRLGLLILAGVSATAILPAGRLPRYRPDEIPDPSPVGAGPDPVR